MTWVILTILLALLAACAVVLWCNARMWAWEASLADDDWEALIRPYDQETDA